MKTVPKPQKRKLVTFAESLGPGSPEVSPVEPPLAKTAADVEDTSALKASSANQPKASKPETAAINENPAADSAPSITPEVLPAEPASAGAANHMAIAKPHVVNRKAHHTHAATAKRRMKAPGWGFIGVILLLAALFGGPLFIMLASYVALPLAVLATGLVVWKVVDRIQSSSGA